MSGRSDSERVSPRVLRNVGVPVPLAVLDEKGEPVYDGDEHRTRTVHIRFTANEVAEMEDAFDGFTAEVDDYVDEFVFDANGQPTRDEKGRPETARVLKGRATRTFYGIEAFQAIMSLKPIKGTRKAMSVALGMSPEETGNAMLDTEISNYTAAVTAAWSIASGMDPTKAAMLRDRTLEQARVAQDDALAELGLGEETTTPDTEVGSPGTNGSGLGAPSESIEASTSSGP